MLGRINKVEIYFLKYLRMSNLNHIFYIIDLYDKPIICLVIEVKMIIYFLGCMYKRVSKIKM